MSADTYRTTSKARRRSNAVLISYLNEKTGKTHQQGILSHILLILGCPFTVSATTLPSFGGKSLFTWKQYVSSWAVMYCIGDHCCVECQSTRKWDPLQPVSCYGKTCAMAFKKVGVHLRCASWRFRVRLCVFYLLLIPELEGEPGFGLLRWSITSAKIANLIYSAWTSI